MSSLLPKAKIHNVNYDDKTPQTFDKITSQYLNTEKFRHNDHNNIKSFLRITSTRYQYSDGRWRGELTWFWTFTNKRTNKSFVTYNKAQTTKDKSLRLTGVFSFLQRTDANSQWQVKFQKEVKESDNRRINKANFNQHFPKPYWWTQEGKFDERYYDNWKFIYSINDFDKTCEFDTDKNDCKGSPSKTETWTGEYEWIGASGFAGYCHNWYHKKWCDKVYMWSSNYDHKDGLQWYDYMYGGSGGTHNLKSWIGAFYEGFWKKLSG